VRCAWQEEAKLAAIHAEAMKAASQQRALLAAEGVAKVCVPAHTCSRNMRFITCEALNYANLYRSWLCSCSQSKAWAALHSCKVHATNVACV
jgi:hypothetical protein